MYACTFFVLRHEENVFFCNETYLFNFYPNFTKVKMGYGMMIDGRRAAGVKTFVTLFSETTKHRDLKFCMQPPIVVLQVVSDFQVCRRSTS